MKNELELNKINMYSGFGTTNTFQDNPFSGFGQPVKVVQMEQTGSTSVEDCFDRKS